MKRFTAILLVTVLISFLAKGQEYPYFEKVVISELPKDSSINEVFDFNNDGYNDIVTLSIGTNRLQVFINNKAGGFNLLSDVECVLEGDTELYMMSGDFDNDSFTDLFITFKNSNLADIIYVYKNISGNSLDLFFNKTVFSSEPSLEDRFVMFDINRDNYLDIISGSRMLLYNGITFNEVSTITNWPRYDTSPTSPPIRFKNLKMSNPVALGNINLVNNILYNPNRYMYPLTSLLTSNPEIIYFSGDRTISIGQTNENAIYLDLTGNGFEDRLSVTIEENILKFKCYFKGSNQNYILESYQSIYESDVKHLHWDVGDINGDGVTDIIYAYTTGNDVRVGGKLLSRDELGNIFLWNSIDTINYESLPYYSQNLSMKLADMDNDNNLDIVVGNIIFYNQINKSIKRNGKPFDLNLNVVANKYYNFTWSDTTKDTLNVLTYDILIKNNRTILKDEIALRNTFPNAKLPQQIITPKYFSLNSLDTGWNYWSVRSINPALQGSEWAEIDSIYVNPNRIMGNHRVCPDTEERYSAFFANKNTTSIQWLIGDSIIRTDNLLLNVDTGFINVFWKEDMVKNQVLKVLLFNSDNVALDTITLDVFIKVYPEVKVKVPEFAVSGEQLVLKNEAKGYDSLVYRWTVFTPDIGQIIGIGLDSISFTVPNRTFNVSMRIDGNDNYCSTSLLANKYDTTPPFPVARITTIDKSLITSDFEINETACGKDSVTMKMKGEYFDDWTYSWIIENVNIVKNLHDSLLVIHWDDFSSRKIGLTINVSGYQSDTTFKTVARNPYPEIAYSINPHNCHATAIPLLFSGTNTNQASFNWNFDNADIVFGEGAGPYNLTWNTGGIKNLSLLIDDGGCVADTNFIVEISEPAAMQPLNGVSVNAKNHAVIMWDSPAVNIDSVILYKESEQSNVYKRIAALEASEATTFADTTTDCSSQPYRFKLAVVDSCGYKSEMSDYHKTMHLMLNKGLNNSWNLVWSDYEGLEVGTYSIYRGSNPEAMYKIADVSGNVYTFTDQNPPIGDLYYAIVASNISNKSTSLKSALSNPAKIQSNMVETRIFNAIPHNFAQKWFNINVNNKILRIESLQQSQYSFSVNDLTGKRLFISSKNSGHSVYNMSFMPEGVYILIIDVDNRQQMFKIKL